MNPVYLTYYKRSAFSRAHPKKTEVDAFAQLRGDSMLAQLIEGALHKGAIDSQSVDELTIGCALGIKEQWSFGGRYSVLQTELGDQCASRSLDQQCGSGLAAIRSASLNIASGSADIALAAGYENMTRIPMGPSLFAEGSLTVPPDCRSEYNLEIALNMGLTAENLMRHAGISRQQMDSFALNSHQRADAAQQRGFFADEIQALDTGESNSCALDANIRAQSSLEQLAQLHPAFDPEGQITAGNSSPLTSGAALCVLMSEAALAKTGTKAIARILGVADRGVKPELMGSAVVPAVERLLQQFKLNAQEIDLWEINEAFSVVPLFAIEQLDIDPLRVNINGGALALGHPLGATGIRLAGTLARALAENNGRYGIAAACIGGGQGIALLIERC